MERGVFCVGENMGGRYQITQALEGDLFASYFAAITSWGYAPYNNDHYALYFDWYDAPFNDAYEKIMTPWKAIYDATDEFSPARAMATVVKVFAMQRITDMYGPIPYSQFGTAVQNGNQKTGQNRIACAVICQCNFEESRVCNQVKNNEDEESHERNKALVVHNSHDKTCFICFCCFTTHD